MKLSENFTLEEMISSSTASKRNIPNLPEHEQIANLRRLCIEILQPVRNAFGKPLTVTSGFRSQALNKAVGGSLSSQHLQGEAADLVSRDNKKLWSTIIGMIKSGEIEVGQLINEKNLKWIHISLPSERHHNQILAI